MTDGAKTAYCPEVILRDGVPLPPAIVRRTFELYGERAVPWLESLPGLVAALERQWHITVTAPFPALSFNVVLEARTADGRAVVLKIGLPTGEIAIEMAALQLVAGDGAVPVLYADAELGAMVLVRIEPGIPLRAVVDDAEATTIAADAMRRYWRPVPERHPFPTVADWGLGFQRLRRRFDGGTGPLPRALVERAERSFADLLASQGAPVVLHGDLHHENILAFATGWTVIDPKGLVGEPEYELGAFLRNWDTLLSDPAIEPVLARRVAIFCDRLHFDAQRVREWAVAQAVLSAWWTIEDGGTDWRTGIAFAEHLARLRL